MERSTPPNPKWNGSNGSRFCQTVFNSVNVLVGVGLLSLPSAMSHAGWICGLTLLAFSAALTAHTARVLARCMNFDKSFSTYVDIAHASYGGNGRALTIVLFSLNLVATCVALIVLFGDTMNLLFPVLSIVQWKVVCGVMALPLQFLTFPILSRVSIIGIFLALESRWP